MENQKKLYESRCRQIINEKNLLEKNKKELAEQKQTLEEENQQLQRILQSIKGAPLCLRSLTSIGLSLRRVRWCDWRSLCSGRSGKDSGRS